MRRALVESLERHPGVFEGYVKGSICICVSCAHPIYRLDRSISVGASGRQMVDAFRPILPVDLEDLATREDIDAGVRAICKALEPAQRRAYADAIPAPRAGTPAVCPRCNNAFVQGRTAEASDTTDRAFVWEPLMIPPRGHAVRAIRGGRVH